MPDTDEQVKQDEKPADAPTEREAVEARVESPAPPPAERVAERTEAPPEARTDGGARAERTDRPERHDRGPRPERPDGRGGRGHEGGGRGRDRSERPHPVVEVANEEETARLVEGAGEGRGRTLDLSQLKEMNIQALNAMA